MKNLSEKKVAILVTDGFEQSEFTEPKKAVETAGAKVHVVSLENGPIKSWIDGNWGSEFQVDKTVDEVSASDYVSAICHGPWLLAEAGVLEGRKITSFSSIKTDLINAGAHWVDEEVVVDQGLTTSRSPNDLPAFCKKVVEEIAEGKHAKMSESA